VYKRVRRESKLWEPLRRYCRTGQQLRLIAGCDERQRTCPVEKFNNLLNFSRLSDLPSAEIEMMAVPKSSGSNTGITAMIALGASVGLKTGAGMDRRYTAMCTGGGRGGLPTAWACCAGVWPRGRRQGARGDPCLFDGLVERRARSDCGRPHFLAPLSAKSPDRWKAARRRCLLFSHAQRRRWKRNIWAWRQRSARRRALVSMLQTGHRD